jgi:hypothetical protein
MDRLPPPFEAETGENLRFGGGEPTTALCDEHC